MTLGLTNLYLKRLIRKGYVKCVTVSPIAWCMRSAQGRRARKGRLTYEFMPISLDFYRDARQHLRRSLTRAVAQRQPSRSYGWRRRRAVYLLVRDMGLELVAVFNTEPLEHFLGRAGAVVVDHSTVSYDVLVVAVLDARHGEAAPAVRRPDGVLMLRPDWPAAKPGERIRCPGTAR
jgi:hypothetical protein